MPDRTKPPAKRSGPAGDVDDCGIAALKALGWVLADDDRASRLVALTGVEPGEIRSRIDDRALHAAVLAYLMGHEADLTACADAIGETPERLAACHGTLAA